MPHPLPQRRTLRNVLLTLVAVLVVSLGLWMTVPPAPPAPATAGGPPPPPAGSLPVVAGLGGDFSLPATSGGEVSLASLRGKVVLLNFGFTNCPDVCPMVLTRMGHALRELEPQVDMTRVQPLFVTFDPERDTLDHLQQYVSYFHPSIVGLRGSAEQTADVARRFKVIYLRQDVDSASGYVFQHSDFIYLLDSSGRVRLLVSSHDPEAALVEGVKKLLREAEAI